MRARWIAAATASQTFIVLDLHRTGPSWYRTVMVPDLHCTVPRRTGPSWYRTSSLHRAVTTSQTGLNVGDAPQLIIFQLMRFFFSPVNVNSTHYSSLEVNFSFVHHNSRRLLRGVHFQSHSGLWLLIDHSGANLGPLTLVVSFKCNF